MTSVGQLQASDPVEVLIRAVDTPTATYLYTRWLDDPAHIATTVLDRNRLAALIDELDNALITPRPGETPDRAIRRAMTKGAFADPDRERSLSTRLAAALLPDTFWASLADRAARSRPVQIRITPSRLLARLPWELLPDPDGTRLIEHATLSYEVPATVHWKRHRLPEPWAQVRDRPALATIDPRVPVRDPRLGPTLTDRNQLIAELGVTDTGPHTTRETLAKALAKHPRSWLYFGHVSLRHDEPGSASLHLSDGTTIDTHGKRRPYAGHTDLIGTHRHLSALDLVLGTSQDHHRDPDLHYASTTAQPGHQLWPMPPRVALIACESGGDHASSETFGLILAAHTNGAEYVTATRWTLPTDTALPTHLPALTGTRLTSTLATAVHTALNTEQPIATLRTWQLHQLEKWTTTGDPTHTPLIFTSIATHHAPPRQPDGTPLNHTAPRPR